MARANQNCKESFSARQATALRRLAAGSSIVHRHKTLLASAKAQATWKDIEIFY